ncbi:hypothetical protein Emed_002201 [Eimeria media]
MRKERLPAPPAAAAAAAAAAAQQETAAAAAAAAAAGGDAQERQQQAAAAAAAAAVAAAAAAAAAAACQTVTSSCCSFRVFSSTAAASAAAAVAVEPPAAATPDSRNNSSSSSSCCCCRLVAASPLVSSSNRRSRGEPGEAPQLAAFPAAAAAAAAGIAAAAAAAGAAAGCVKMGLVSDFYRGQTVLLTGASGFVGKVVLARLLQQCDCRKIYVLLRPLSKGTAKDRLQQSVLKSGVFDELREQLGEQKFLSFAEEKVEALAGDLLQQDLGLGTHAPAVQREVSVIIHMAASVHFNSPLKDNYRSNVEGSLRVLDFGTKCPNLQVLVHTSTCYVNSDLRGKVKEGFVPLPWDTDDLHLAVSRLIDIADRGSAENYEELEKQLLGRFPNTYAFTKRLCEALIAREWQLRNGDAAAAATQQQQQRSLLRADMRPLHFPICILRPSIIGCAYKYPKRGWVDNVNATGGMLLLCALGILQCLPANPDLIGDQVPVDVVADSLIVSAATTQQWQQQRELQRLM